MKFVESGRLLRGSLLHPVAHARGGAAVRHPELRAARRGIERANGALARAFRLRADWCVATVLPLEKTYVVAVIAALFLRVAVAVVVRKIILLLLLIPLRV